MSFLISLFIAFFPWIILDEVTGFETDLELDPGTSLVPNRVNAFVPDLSRAFLLTMVRAFIITKVFATVRDRVPNRIPCVVT